MPIEKSLGVFVPAGTQEFGARVCRSLGVQPSPYEARPFKDGEYTARPFCAVAGCDTFVIQPYLRSCLVRLNSSCAHVEWR